MLIPWMQSTAVVGLSLSLNSLGHEKLYPGGGNGMGGGLRGSYYEDSDSSKDIIMLGICETINLVVHIRIPKDSLLVHQAQESLNKCNSPLLD